MTAYAVSMVKDEVDIIHHTIAHLLGQQLDGIIIADNASVDGTRDILDAYEARFAMDDNFDFHVIDDTDVAYYQSEKMTNLAMMAMARGADWVIPFDADEIWEPPAGQTLGSALMKTGSETTILRAELYNYFPTSKDPANVPDPVARIGYRDVKPMSLRKVICWTHPELVIHQGNHGASLPVELERPADTEIWVRHYPWRSFRQYVNKIRNGYAAYQATNLDASVGAHWRQHGEMLESGGEEALRALWDEWYFDPPTTELIYDPADT